MAEQEAYGSHATANPYQGTFTGWGGTGLAFRISESAVILAADLGELARSHPWQQHTDPASPLGTYQVGQITSPVLIKATRFFRPKSTQMIWICMRKLKLQPLKI